MKQKIITITALLLMLVGGYAIGQNVSNYMEQGGARWVIGGSLDVVSGGDLDIESGATFKSAGQAITLPTAAGAILQSSLTTNQIDVANSIWGVSNGLTFEGATANAFQTNITPSDPAFNCTLTIPASTVMVAVYSTLATNDEQVANSIWLASNSIVMEGATANGFETTLSPAGDSGDATVTVPNISGTMVLSTLATNAQNKANSIWGVSNGLTFEGATPDNFETSITLVDPLEDNTITIPEETGGVLLSSVGSNADIDDATASTNWTASDPAGWTVDVGTSNSRAGGNSLEFSTDTDVNDELVMDAGAVLTDALGDNFIGFWMRNTGGTIAADELDVDLRTPASTPITNCTNLQIPAMTADDWTWVEFATSTCDLSRFQMLAIMADTGITANTAVDFDAIITYDISNGHGPARGRLEYVPVATGTVTRGQVVCWPNIGTDTNGVSTCGANDYAPAGIATSTSTTFVIIQTSGLAIMESGNAIGDNGDVDVLSGAVTIDDAGSIENSIGWATEAAADANDMIYIRLQF